MNEFYLHILQNDIEYTVISSNINRLASSDGFGRSVRAALASLKIEDMSAETLAATG